jgi:hypothetical protein
MSVQQLIAHNDSILADAEVTASAVSPSTSIRLLGMTRQGTGLALLEGEYTGHDPADYDVEIVSGDGTGRASTPKFIGVGSGSLSVTAADIPAQEVTLTLVTPPFSGSPAECLIGSDVTRAVPNGVDGNRVYIEVDASGLSMTASGAATLEELAAEQDELTAYLWDIEGVIASTDLSGNVPAAAPRVRFGSDPMVYRVIKDFSGGGAKVILTPAAVRDIPEGAPIHIVSGTYTVTVTGEGLGTGGADIVETYTGITTGYDLMAALSASDLLRPAYTPAPVVTPGGNARIDLPVTTVAYALIAETSQPGARPSDLSARATASAETITFASRGNGAWSVTGTASGALPDAREGESYAPAASPVLLTIPARPEVSSQAGMPPVAIREISLASRESDEAPLPNICIEGALGINAAPLTITATYARRPDPNDCPCAGVDTPWWNPRCLGLDISNISEGGDGVETEYQTRLVDLFEWQRDFIGGNAAITSRSAGSQTAVKEWHYSTLLGDPGATWHTTGVEYEDNAAGAAARGASWLGTTTDGMQNIYDAYPSPTEGDYAGGLYTVSSWEAGALASADAVDIRLCQSITSIFADCLAQVWGDSAGRTAWDGEFVAMQTDMTALAAAGGSSALTSSDIESLVAKYKAAADYCLSCAGIVPGKTDPAGGSVTGCWQDDDGAEYWWLLSDGYAAAFTNKEYYSTRAADLENTREFAFQIRCACADRLAVGDKITIDIASGLSARVWGSSESLKITVIPSRPLYAAGGLAADDTEIWTVSAEDSGGATLPAAELSSANRHYSSGGLVFDLSLGGIPFSLGDKFLFSVEGGAFRWRRDSGVWSSAIAIADETALERGLTVSFLAGQAPSFVTGDLYRFRALQESAPAEALTPAAGRWQWDAGAATITMTWATARKIAALAVVHELPSGATVTAEITEDGTTWIPLPWMTTAVTLRDWLHLASGADTEIKGLRLTFSPPGAVRWIWAGVPFQPQYNASLRLRHLYDLTRARVAGASALLAEGAGASMDWRVLSLADAAKLAALVRSQKGGGDLPLILVPHMLHPDEAFLCRIDDDEFEVTDEYNYEPDDTAHRLLSASLELVPEWRAVA